MGAAGGQFERSLGSSTTDSAEDKRERSSTHEEERVVEWDETHALRPGGYDVKLR